MSDDGDNDPTIPEWPLRSHLLNEHAQIVRASFQGDGKWKIEDIAPPLPEPVASFVLSEPRGTARFAERSVKCLKASGRI